MSEQSKNPEAEKTREYLKLPEFSIRRENGLEIGLILYKQEEVRDILEKEDIDEETFLNYTICFDHPERTKYTLSTIEKNKPWIKDSKKAEAVVRQIVEKYQSSDLVRDTRAAAEESIQEEIEYWEKTMPEYKQGIQDELDFFHPYTETTDVRSVAFAPCGSLKIRSRDGRLFLFGDQAVVFSYKDGIDNARHEFQHTIINPIVDKVSDTLDESQKAKIIELCGQRLKSDYGEFDNNLLCESLIRAYNNHFRKGEKPPSLEDFKKQIRGFTEDQFAQVLSENQGLQERCQELSIKDLAGFKQKDKEYFERFIDDELQVRIYALYEKYDAEKEKWPNFEEFALKELPKILV